MGVVFAESAALKRQDFRAIFPGQQLQNRLVFYGWVVAPFRPSLRLADKQSPAKSRVTMAKRRGENQRLVHQPPILADDNYIEIRRICLLIGHQSPLGAC